MGFGINWHRVIQDSKRPSGIGAGTSAGSRPLGRITPSVVQKTSDNVHASNWFNPQKMAASRQGSGYGFGDLMHDVSHYTIDLGGVTAANDRKHNAEFHNEYARLKQGDKSSFATWLLGNNGLLGAAKTAPGVPVLNSLAHGQRPSYADTATALAAIMPGPKGGREPIAMKEIPYRGGVVKVSPGALFGLESAARGDRNIPQNFDMASSNFVRQAVKPQYHPNPSVKRYSEAGQQFRDALVNDITSNPRALDSLLNKTNGGMGHTDFGIRQGKGEWPQAQQDYAQRLARKQSPDEFFMDQENLGQNLDRLDGQAAGAITAHYDQADAGRAAQDAWLQRLGLPTHTQKGLPDLNGVYGRNAMNKNRIDPNSSPAMLQQILRMLMQQLGPGFSG